MADHKTSLLFLEADRSQLIPIVGVVAIIVIVIVVAVLLLRVKLFYLFPQIICHKHLRSPVAMSVGGRWYKTTKGDSFGVQGNSTILHTSFRTVLVDFRRKTFFCRINCCLLLIIVCSHRP